MTTLEMIQQMYAHGFTGTVPHDCRPVEHVTLATSPYDLQVRYHNAHDASARNVLWHSLDGFALDLRDAALVDCSPRSTLRFNARA